MAHRNNQSFSTKDRENDNWPDHCAVKRRSGWWHGYCTHANLNGPYYGSKQTGDQKVIYWHLWRNNIDSMKRVDMKFRLNYP